MSNPPALQDANLALVTERVERLLLRYDEVQRTNELLKVQMAATQAECEQLKSRLGAARSRIDALLDRLPANLGAATVKAGEASGAEPLARHQATAGGSDASGARSP